MNMFDLTGKSIVIIGSRGYLGTEFCKSALEFGATVHAVDIIATGNSDYENLKHSYGKQLKEYVCDSTNKDELQECCNKIVEHCSRVDVLVNTTTMKGDDFYLPFDKVSQEGWEVGILGNLTATFIACQVFMPLMAAQGSGSVINIASIYGVVGNDQRIYIGSNLNECYLGDKKNSQDEEQIYSHPVYPAAKGGVIALTRYLAAYYGGKNVRVNCITPGGVYHPSENEEFLKKYSERTPLGRKAKPDEINGALIFLASDGSSYVTGHNLIVDGGWTCW